MTSSDALTRFVFDAAPVRGALVTLDRTTRDILGSHSYPPALTRALAELCAAAPLIASTLKLDGSLIVQLAGAGPVRLAVVECSDALDIRATAQWSDAADRLPAAATLAELAGDRAQARLSITLDPRDGGSMYQGIVALEATTTARLIEHYLTTSEQLQSRVVLASRDRKAAGLLVQRLPGATSADDAIWHRIEALIDAIDPEALLDPRDHSGALASLFPEDDLRVFEPRAARFRCSCSRERVENALKIAGRAEIDASIEERGGVEVTCEFCNRRYRFTPDEARAVFAAQPAESDQPQPATRH
jgi:molecular chaperone Hsp33